MRKLIPLSSARRRVSFAWAGGLLLFTGLSSAQTNFSESAKTSVAPIYYNSENLRSDTFNILKYTINLEIGDFANKFIKGNTQVRFVPKMNGQNFIRLDLLKLIVDSVRENTASSTLTLTSTYNDTILKVNFLSAKNIIDTTRVTIYYHGLPQQDATGWGGFYFNNAQGAQYAYNLGVGFGAKPHNYGRIWFPCFDNFIERSKYEFNITCDTTRRAHCNGMLVSDIISNNKRTRKWVLNEEIPTYLACVTVANYRQVNWNINALNGNIPITLTAFAADTTSMKNGFVNLKSCINGFENYYGPYKWPRFGYYLVPFNGGAMEHVTNIAYPRFAIGTLTYEDLMAHELSHHWWGNLVTCETPEDMWINEGMASFSAYMFFEWQYGKQSYLNRVKSDHDALLQFLHFNEGGFRAVSGVPHSLTYSDHVYKKGADIAHTLRGYLGDSAFFAGLKYTLQQNSFKSLNSNDFKTLMQTGSGQNTSDFFTNWVFTGGWSHFAIDSIKYTQTSPPNYSAEISLRQKTYGTSTLHSSVPLEITFFNSNWTSVVKKVVMSGATNNFTVGGLPFQPVYAALNYDSKINDATSHESKVIKTAGVNNYTLGKINFIISNPGQDSSLLRVVHNYVKPDPFKMNPANHKLSNQHFWKVEGILSNGFVSTARFNYNGTKTTSGAFGYMDTLLTQVNGDSVWLFYRQNAADDWKLVTKANKVKTSSKTGYFDVDSLILGEYSFGNADLSLLGVKQNAKTQAQINIYPNPAVHNCTVELQETNPVNTYLSIYSVDGKLIQQQQLVNKTNVIDITMLKKGTYLFEVQSQNKATYQRKVLIE